MSKVGFDTRGLKLVSETCGPVALGAKLGSQTAAFASTPTQRVARQSKIVVRDIFMRISDCVGIKFGKCILITVALGRSRLWGYWIGHVLQISS